MAKQSGQKLKLLVLSRILTEETDEDHPLTATQLAEKLAEEGIPAERKSIYSDLDALTEAGYDIVNTKRGYFLASDRFESAEVMTLADAVLASRFLTDKKSRILIDKLGGLLNRYQRTHLHSSLRAGSRKKGENESVLYSLDAIRRAKSEGKWVAFRYFEWAASFSGQGKFVRHHRHGGEEYLVAVKGILWVEDNAYLVGYDNRHQQIRNYRVDRMDRVSVSERPVGIIKELDFDLSDYADKLFGMFSGKEERVTLCFPNSLANAAVDYFGADAFLSPDDRPDRFRITAPVALSPRFYGWVLGFGGQVELLSPESAREELRRQAEEAGKIHQKF